MRIFLILLFLNLVRSRKDDDLLDADSDESLVYFSYRAKLTLDLRGTIRNHFGLEVGIRALDRNAVCSPIAAILPLAKLLLGVRQKSHTEKQLLAAVGLERRSSIKGTFIQAIKELQHLKGGEIDLASRIYRAKDKKLWKRFKERSKIIFGSSVETLDLDKPDESVEIINNWVKNYTNSRIKSVVTKKNITPAPSLIVISAIYFAGQWKYPFQTAPEQNFYGPTRTYKVPMISRYGDYKYMQSEKLNAQIIELPYVGEQSSLLIVLPNEKKGLPILLRTLKISMDLLRNAFRRMISQIVEVTIPKFHIETVVNLRYLYDEMNITDALRLGTSSLNQVVKGETMFVSHAIQKAIIQVDEKGVEGGMVEMLPISLVPQTTSFMADHPFLFFVTAYREQLLAGVVNYP